MSKVLTSVSRAIAALPMIVVQRRGWFFFFQAEDGIRDYKVTGVQTCALPIFGQAAQAAGVRSVVFVSAIGAKLDPHYKYYTSRWMGEQELAKTGVAGTILRFSFVLAEEGGILNDFERAIVGPFAIIPGSRQAKMQPI